MSYRYDDDLRIIIIGGMGFVGQNLTNSLLSQGYNILVIDNIQIYNQDISYMINHEYIQSNFNYKKIDILDNQSLDKAFDAYRPYLVIHLASMGMSGSSMLSNKCKSVNVDGTKALLELCLKYEVQHFIYTSSYNVIFGGKDIHNGDESHDYYPVALHTDQYSATKSMAEALVLSYNGRKYLTTSSRSSSSSGSSTSTHNKSLMTASIRPAAIYGINEKRHLPRIVTHMDHGLFMFRIGDALVDWVHIDNLVQAFNLLIKKMTAVATNNSSQDAMTAITSMSNPSPAGQAYFISDGTPIHNFEFLRPLCEARGRVYPTLVLSTFFMLHLAYVFELIFYISSRLDYPIEPFLTRAEVLKVGINHYFSIKKASQELGYKPLLTSHEGALQIAEYYGNCLHNHDYFDFPPIILWILILYGLIMLSLVSILNPSNSSSILHSPLISPINQLAYSIFQNQFNLQIVLLLAIAAHVFESIYAMYLARGRLNCRNTWLLWGIQTLLLGYPSLQLLMARESFMISNSNGRRENIK